MGNDLPGGVANYLYFIETYTQIRASISVLISSIELISNKAIPYKCLYMHYARYLTVARARL